MTFIGKEKARTQDECARTKTDTHKTPNAHLDGEPETQI